MMDPAFWSAQSQDIGTVVAIVGTKGWQCRLCSSTFPRSFSIDHHMVASHFQQIQEESALPSTNNTASVGERQGQSLSRAENDTRSANGPRKAEPEKKNDTVGHGMSSSEGVDGVRSTPASSEAHSNSRSPEEGGKGCRRGEGFVPIKVEPGVESGNTSENGMDEENLPVYFEEDMKQQTVSPSVDRDSRSSSGHGNTVIQNNKNVKAGLNSEENGSLPQFMECENTLGGRSHVRRFGMQKLTDSFKPYKRCTCSCGQEFESKHEFKHHRRNVHCRLKHKSFVCHICHAEYQYKRGLNRHFIDKGMVPHVCSHCPKQFHDKISLKEHRQLCHNSEVPDRSSSETNATDHTHLSFSENEQASQHGAGDNFPWECSKCKQHFVKKCTFRVHLRECGILALKDEKRCFTCNLCGSSFPWLVDYHRHYVHDHKLAFLRESANSPALSLPFAENSPVPSPVSSVTSEINTAMAGVSLNQSKAAGVPENSSPCSSSIDLTSHSGLDEEASVEQDGSRAVSNPQVMTPCLKVHLVTSAANSSSPLSATTAANSSEPSSLTSTTSSSNPKSFSSDFSSLGPLSLTTTASSSGQTSEVESIIISDTEEIQSSDSSSDSDEDWEIITDHKEEEKGMAADCETEHQKGNLFSRKDRKPCTEQQSQHPFHPPPPPHPHCFPPPPPFYGKPFFPPHGHHFPPPPFHHFHHHPRFARGGFFHGRFMRGCLFGAGRFGPPDWFTQEDSTHSNSPKSENETDAPGTSSEPTCSAVPNQESNSSQYRQTMPDQDHSADSTPFSHAAHFSKWAGKWKEGKAYYKTVWKKMWSIVKSRQMDGQFLVCPEYDCQQTFTKESELDEHCQENHPTLQEFICFICQQPFSQPVSFNRHVREHCETFFPMAGHRGRGRGRGLMGLGRRMFKHMWKWGGPYDMFSSPLLGHGQQAAETDKDSNSPEGSSSKDFKECPVCKKRYRANSRESFFERHVNSHYGVEVYSFECEECGKKFLEKGKLTAHQLKHKSSPYICKECGNSYQSKTSLKRHERIHTGERPHKCPDCNEGFIELRQLERHRMKHTGQDPFQCKVCGKGFTLKDSLLNHVRKQHPNESPVLCCRRAMPTRSESDYQQSKDGMASDTQAGNGTLGAEPQEPSFMELD